MTPSKNARKKSRSQRSPSTSEQKKKNLAFTPPRITREQIKETGEQASQVLNSPVYNLAVNSVVDDLGLQILQTEPHETQKREWLYTQGAALGRINQKLVEFVQLAQSLHMEELAAEESAQREHDADLGFPSAPTN